MKQRTRRLGALLLCVLLIAADQATKLLAVARLKDQTPFVLLSGVLEFRYLENRGAAFGILQGQKIFLVLFTGLLSALIIYFYFHVPEGRRHLPIRIFLIMLLSGAIGNFIDRCRLDYVIDFIYFKLIDFPIFNVADCYVTIAVILFAIAILFVYKEEEMDFLFHPFSREKK